MKKAFLRDGRDCFDDVGERCRMRDACERETAGERERVKDFLAPATARCTAVVVDVDSPDDVLSGLLGRMNDAEVDFAWSSEHRFCGTLGGRPRCSCSDSVSESSSWDPDLQHPVSAPHTTNTLLTITYPEDSA